MLKNCKNCSQDFEITDEDLKFYGKVSPEFKGKKYLIPAPTLCSDCRRQRRLTYRNEKFLYKRKCDMCEKAIIAIFPQTTEYKVFCNECFWSDKWDSANYGQDFDFNKSFFEQFSALEKSVPHIALFQDGTSENCEYVNYGVSNKNCYMILGGYCEDVYYSYGTFRSKSSVDCHKIISCELCYGDIDCTNCYNLVFSQDCVNCSDSYFLKDCIGCNQCFCSVNQQNAKYVFCNEQLSEKEYKEKIQNIKFNTDTINKWLLEQKKIFIKIPKKYIHGVDNQNVSGDYLNNCSNVKECYDSIMLTDSAFCEWSGLQTHNIYDGTNVGPNSQFCYEIGSSTNTNNSLFIQFCRPVYDAMYCQYCFSSSNLFGCVGLNHKEYCILNKQYTKEEYKILVPKIIEHMIKSGEFGEFFPSSISPFGYNETVAQEYFPLLKEEAKSKGFKWSDYEPEFPKVEKIIPANLLPDNTSDIPDDILNWAIMPDVEKDLKPFSTISTNRPFKIIKPELDFYRKMNLPIPRRHPDERHKNRMALRNPRKLFDRKCMKCNAEIETTYSPERPEIVYCEKCYLESVY